MILIVEDEAVSRRALQKLLRISGYETRAVASADEARRVLSNGTSPGMALVDVELPGSENGLELVHWLERAMPSVVPVLITATENERVSRFQAMHPATYFRKPLNVESLLNLIQSTPAA